MNNSIEIYSSQDRSIQLNMKLENNTDKDKHYYQKVHYGVKWICIIINSIITITIVIQFKLSLKNSIFLRNIIFLTNELIGTIFQTIKLILKNSNDNSNLVIPSILASSFQGILYSICFLITNYDLVSEKWKCIKKAPTIFDEPIIIDDNSNKISE